MRRITPILVLTVIAAACSGTAEPTTTTSRPVTATTAAATTTTTTTTSVAVEPATTTTQAEVDGTMIDGLGDGAAFETIPETPPDVFESFAATLKMEIALDELAIELTGEGVWTTDAFECTITTELGGLGLSQSVVSSPETLWLDTGSGYEPSALFGTAAQSVVSSCPSSPLFWADYTSDGLGRPVGDTETIDGRPAIKTDLTEALDVFGGFGLVPGFEDATINELVMWVDVETNVVLRFVADMELGAEFLAELGVPAGDGAGSVAMVMDIRVERVNDPTLVIELPAEG